MPTYGLYMSAAGADTQSKRVQMLSNNLANVDTPGFKSEFAAMMARDAEAIERGDMPAGSRSTEDIGGGVRFQETVTDFSRGNLKQTGMETDFALNDIDGKSFFAVERQGETLLTRAGNFKFDSSGNLITQSGEKVLSRQGNPIQTDPSGPSVQIRRDGSIWQGDTKLELAIKRTDSMQDLQKTGDNLFKSSSTVRDAVGSERDVRSGVLEMSTVKPTQAMVHLIEASRAYEANIKMIQSQDDMLGNLLNRVLRQ